MKVIGINGSPRKDGNTAIIIKKIFKVLEQNGIETELIQLAGLNLRGCQACSGCAKSLDKKCVQPDDGANAIIGQLVAADGIIFGSPTYFADVTAGLKALMERAGFVSKANGGLFKHKVGVAVTAVRRGGAIHTIDTLNHFFMWAQMFIVGSTYWNMVHGREIGEVENDAEGLANMQNIGENMALLLKKLNK